MLGERVARPYRLLLQVRWSDFDPLKHVNAARYVTFLEEARDAWLSDTLGLGSGEHYVVASLSLDYHQPLNLGVKRCFVEILPTKIGRTSIVLDERVVDEHERTVVSARAVIVMWDPSSEPPTPRAITETERELIGID